MNVYTEKQSNFWGAVQNSGGGVKEVFAKYLLPFNPFIHRNFKHLGGGEGVFLRKTIFSYSFGLSK
jgi:hypothetical protein